MDSVAIELKCIWSVLLIASFMCNGTFSDMGKMSSSQNHFSTSANSHFTTKNNTRVIAQKGGLAILPCVVKLNSPATVSWIRRKDFQLLTVGLSTHSSDKRFLVEHTRHMGHWSLRIKSVREEDRGFYECQLSIYPTQSIFIELKVVEAVAEITGTPDLHIDEGSTLRLECKLKRATENPSFVFWYHDSKMVNYDTQDGFSVTSTTVNIPTTVGATYDGSSLFTSSVSNNYKDKNTITSSNNNNLISANNLSSSSSNNSSSSNRSVHANGYSSSLASVQHQSSYLLTPSTSFLTIQEVHFHHAGNYTCAPSNARPASITVHVLRDEKPAAMQHANRSFVDGDTNSSSGASSSTSSASSTSASGARSSKYCSNSQEFKQLNAMLHHLYQQRKIPSLIWLLAIVTLICAYHKIDR